MRLFFFGNGALAHRVLTWLKAHGEDVVGIALHPADRRREGEELLATADLMPDQVFQGDHLAERPVLTRIAALKPDVGLSVMFGYILRHELLSLFPRGCLNLHPALLPYNRGAHPNVWSIIDRTPAGATLHYIDDHVDTGPILAQRPVDVAPIDTGRTLYEKLEQAAFELLVDNWEAFKEGRLEGTPQLAGAGTSHKVRDLATIDRIDLDKTYTARELIDLLRARTFCPYPGSYFVAGQRKVYVRVELEFGDEVDE